MEYVNENCTLVTFETDVYQTWMFDLVYKKSFVAREHVNDDTIGLHTIPENLETGEYIVDDVEHDTTLNDLVYVIQSTKSTTGVGLLATNYGGVYLACRCIFMP